jgi:FAD/FMN-containing dehydrogenase
MTETITAQARALTTARFQTTAGATWTADARELGAFAGRLAGRLSGPGEADYERARTLWNAMIDRRPGAVVPATSSADVTHAVEFARERQLLLSIRAAGHNIAGSAVTEGGLLVDLSPMRSIQVDPVARTARVGPGVTLGELDRETQAFGLAAPVGINSTTGIAGLTLGGGFGWISRKHGLTIDSLAAADVVLASGRKVRASATENPELFWGLRGGGGNFGVVTSFEFRLHAVGPEVTAGFVVHPFDGARDLLRAYRRTAAMAGDESTCWAVLRKAPPLPFLPVEVHGREVVVLAMCHVGDAADAARALAPFRALGRPIADVVGPAPFVAWQQALDPLLTAGRRNYWKSHNFADLGDAAIDAVVDFAGRLPSPECEVLVAQMGGAVNRVPADATAYPHRDAGFIVNLHTRWGDAAQDAECIAWARGLFDALAPHATGGVYVNFMPGDEARRVSGGAYGPNYERLARLKARLDPTNLFRANQNIAPAAQDA